MARAQKPLYRSAGPKHSTWFSHFASKVAHFTGRPICFFGAAGIVVVWALSGPFLGFSDLWQLTINTGTTIITFMMVFLIQTTQNRDTAAIQIKLDELIRATKAAHNSLLDLEELSEDELEVFRQRYVELARVAKENFGLDLEDVSKIPSR